ncbi:replication-relaxation family protein [Streptomyces sp. NPDC006458]|uniref:replication-relaxation family protein n=1 Tax=Streptomyces sp. NPDC006458 TaxID=3154302 RepID=UPI0033B8F9E0
MNAGQHARTSPGTRADTATTTGTDTDSGISTGAGAAAVGHKPSPRDPLPHQLLTALAQHRMATTDQLRAMLRPGTARQTVWEPLNTLRQERLVDSTVLPASHGARAWYLTGKGARLTRELPALRGRPPYPVTTANAASLKTPHTLTTVRAHLAFATDARERGDEHGYLDWTPEVAHPLGDREHLIADAVMHYTLHHTSHDHSENESESESESENSEGENSQDRGRGRGRTKMRAFIEIDRATMSSERLAAKLIDYARLHTYQPRPARHTPQPAGPAWLRRYPLYPRILFILTGASRRVLDNRIHDLQAMTAQHPHVTALAHHVPLGAAVLEDLETHSPQGDTWTPLTGGPPRPWTEL